MIVSIRRYLWASQLSLFFFLAICSLIIPSVTEKNGGVSNFGDHVSTIVFYALSFALCIVFLCLAAAKLIEMDDALRNKARLLIALALMDLLVMVSTFPRRLGPVYYEVHDWLGIGLYAYEFCLAIWCLVRQLFPRTIIFLGIQTIGSAIGLLSIFKVIHFLYYGQVVGAIGFGLVLATTLPIIVEIDYRASDTNDMARLIASSES